MPSKIPAGNKNIIRVRVIIHIITAKIKPHILFFKIPTADIQFQLGFNPQLKLNRSFAAACHVE